MQQKFLYYSMSQMRGASPLKATAYDTVYGRELSTIRQSKAQIEQSALLDLPAEPTAETTSPRGS